MADNFEWWCVKMESGSGVGEPRETPKQKGQSLRRHCMASKMQKTATNKEPPSMVPFI
jgi:hypothetical protein